uniref:Uncharacterized protein n=1 Tax=Romanomermis culicivorax TaxID=13658 RepID=A0A915KTY2_ROMCU
MAGSMKAERTNKPAKREMKEQSLVSIGIWPRSMEQKIRKLCENVSATRQLDIGKISTLSSLFNGRSEFSECFDPKPVGEAPGCKR